MKKLILAALLNFACASLHAAAAFNTVLPGNLNILPGMKVGIGTTNTPAVGLAIVNTGSTDPRGVVGYQISADNLGAQFNGFKARGIESAPTIITTGDGGLILNGWYHDGVAYLKGARISLDSSGTIGVNRTPSEINFWTSTDASPSVLTKRWTIDNTGKLVSLGAQTITTSVGALSIGATDASKISFLVSNAEKMQLSAAANLLIGGTSETGLTGAAGLRTFSATEATTSAGSVIHDGGLLVQKAIFVNSATDSTSITTGSIVTAGGVGITKALWVGGLVNIAGVETISNTTSATSSTTGAFIVGNGSTATSVGIGGGNVNAGGTITTGANNFFRWPSSSIMQCTTDGSIILLNNALNNFTSLQFGGSGAAFAGVFRNGTGISIKTATGGAFSTLTAGSGVFNDTTASTTTGTGSLINAGGFGNAGAINTGGKITTYNSVATAGWGVPAIYGSANVTGQTAANTNVVTYTCGAADGSFQINSQVLVTTTSAEAFAIQVAYTDAGNTARVMVIPLSGLAGTLLSSVNFANGQIPYAGVVVNIRAKAFTPIYLRTDPVGTYTGCTFSMGGSILQIQ